MESIYTKFASTLEQELRKQHHRFSDEIDQLNNQLFDNKNAILRLELRNKKDLEAYEALRRDYNALLLKAKNNDGRVSKEVEVVEKIREVQVPIPNDDLKEEARYWKVKYEEISPKIQKIKM